MSHSRVFWGFNWCWILFRGNFRTQYWYICSIRPWNHFKLNFHTRLLQFEEKKDIPFYFFWGTRYWNWIIYMISDPQYLKFGTEIALWIIFRMPQVWPDLDSWSQICAQSPTMTSLWTGSIEQTCMTFHVSLLPPLSLQLIDRKLHSVCVHPIFTKFQSNAQRESYEYVPTITSWRWNSGAWKSPNFHRPYLRKYCEPGSEILWWYSSGVQICAL